MGPAGSERLISLPPLEARTAHNEGKGFPSRAMKHTAYIKVGSSGGAAIGEEMKLVGITPGASLSLDGKDFYYGVLIPVSEIRLCLDEWNRQQ